MKRVLYEIKRNPLLKILIAVLVLVCLFSLWLFGKNRQKAMDNSKKQVKITKTVSAEYYGKNQDNLFKESPKHIDLKENSDLDSLGEKIDSGKIDMAVLKAQDAIKLMNKDRKFIVLGSLSLLKKEVFSDSLLSNGITDFAGHKVQIIDREAQSQNSDTENDQKERRRARRNSRLNTSEKTMEELIIDVLASKNKTRIQDRNIHVIGESKEATLGSREIVIGSQDEIKSLGSKGRFAVRTGIDNMWQEAFSEDLPEYIMIGSKDFVTNRRGEVAEIIGSMYQAAGAKKDIKITDYSDSNRGVWLVRQFFNKIETYTPNAFKKSVSVEDFFDYLIK